MGGIPCLLVGKPLAGAKQTRDPVLKWLGQLGSRISNREIK